MQGYLIRHATMMKKMKEVKVEIPPLLAGWHLMTRAGIPKWTHVQIKALCSGDLAYDKVSNALMKMFGADHKPNPKDLVRPGLRRRTSMPSLMMRVRTIMRMSMQPNGTMRSMKRKMHIMKRTKMMSSHQTWSWRLTRRRRLTSATWSPGEG